MTNFDRFHREAMEGRGLDSNYTIDNQCFWLVITYEAVTLVTHITINFIVYSILLYNGAAFYF